MAAWRSRTQLSCERRTAPALSVSKSCSVLPSKREGMELGAGGRGGGAAMRGGGGG